MFSQNSTMETSVVEENGETPKKKKKKNKGKDAKKNKKKDKKKRKLENGDGDSTMDRLFHFI